MTGTACCLQRAAEQPNRLDYSNAKIGANKFAGLVKAASDLPAVLPYRWRGGCAWHNGKPDFQFRQATLKGARQTRFLRFRSAGRSRRRYHQAVQPRAQGTARRTAQGFDRSHYLWGPCHRKGEALFNAICAEKGEGIIAKKASAPYAARAPNPAQFNASTPGFVIVGWQASAQKARLPLASLAVP